MGGVHNWSETYLRKIVIGIMKLSLFSMFLLFGMQEFHTTQDGIVFPLDLVAYTSHTVDRFTFYNSMWMAWEETKPSVKYLGFFSNKCILLL